MRRAYYAVALCSAVAFANAVEAKSRLLQRVDLSGRDMSSEGGEAKLYRLSGAGDAACRIDVVHYGEGGKTTFTFTFGAELHSAARTEYEYAAPIYIDGRAKVVSKRTLTLLSARGRKVLRKDFGEYRSFFDARKLAECRGS